MMKGWLFERSREDARLLLSKLGFAVSLPLAAGYLALNPNQPSSSSSARTEQVDGGAAAVHVSAAGGRHLKDEIHIQESEETLAKIIHGDSSIANKDHPPSSKNLLDEEGFLLPPLKQLLLQRRKSSLMRLTHKVEMEQEITSIQEKEGSHLLDCYGAKIKQPVVREVEDQLKITLMKAKSLPLKVQSLNEGNQLVRIGDLEYSEMVSELESLINFLIRAMKSDRWNSGQKMAAIKQRITMLDEKSDGKGIADANSKMMMEVEDEHTNLSMIKLSTEPKNSDSVERLEFENVAASCCSPKGQEVEEEFETNCSAEANEEEMEIKHRSDDKTADILNMLNVWQVNPCSKCEQRTGSSAEEAAECCKSEIWNDETQKNSQQFVVENANLITDQKNKCHKDFDAGNSSLQRSSNESTSCSSDTCSAVKSRHHGSRRKKVLRKLQTMFLGKHNGHTKGKSSANKTPRSSATSDAMESVSTSCSDDARRNLFCDGDLPGFSKQRDSTKHSLKMKSSGGRWQSNTAWCQCFFRSPFEISPAKIFALQDEHTSALHELNRRKPAFHHDRSI